MNIYNIKYAGCSCDAVPKMPGRCNPAPGKDSYGEHFRDYCSIEWEEYHQKGAPSPHDQRSLLGLTLVSPSTLRESCDRECKGDIMQFYCPQFCSQNILYPMFTFNFLMTPPASVYLWYPGPCHPACISVPLFLYKHNRME